MFARLFARINTDRNGRITKEEFCEHFELELPSSDAGFEQVFVTTHAPPQIDTDRDKQTDRMFVPECGM